MMPATRRGFLASAAVLIGCNRAEKKTVAMVPKGSSNVFWQTVHAGAIKAAREYNFRLEWSAPSLETDSSRQIEIVDSVISRRLAGLILAPVERSALAGPVEKAWTRGIPSVIFDSALDSEQSISYVATDNEEGGRIAARRMGQILNGRGKVALLGFMIGSASTMDREHGFQDEIARKFPSVSLVDVRYSNSDRANAMAEAENILSGHPDLAGFFADNEGSSTGAARALKSRQAKQVKLIAFDATDQLISDLEKGWLDSIVVQAPFMMGYQAASAMGKHLAGHTVPKIIHSDVRLVQKSDLARPEIKELLHPNLSSYL